MLDSLSQAILIARGQINNNVGGALQQHKKKKKKSARQGQHNEYTSSGVSSASAVGAITTAIDRHYYTRILVARGCCHDNKLLLFITHFFFLHLHCSDLLRRLGSSKIKIGALISCESAYAPAINRRLRTPRIGVAEIRQTSVKRREY